MSENEDKKSWPSPKKVVVTFGGKKENADKKLVPDEIEPHTPTYVVTSPVDIDQAQVKSSVHPDTPKKEASSGIPESILPKGSRKTEPSMAAESATITEPSMAAQSATITEPSTVGESRESIKAPTYTSPSHGVHASSQKNAQSASTKDQSVSDNFSTPPKSSNGGGSFSGFGYLSFPILLAIAGLVYFTYHTYYQLKHLTQQATQESSSLQTLLSDSKKALDQIAHYKIQHQNEQKTLENLKTQLDESQSRLITLNQDTGWVLSEVNYLLFMANERLNASYDIPTAILQLETAEKKLKQLGDPGLMSVQTSIEQDIAQLKLHPDVDRQKIWTELQAMNVALTKMPFKNLSNTYSDEKAPEASPWGEEAPLWKKGLWKSWLQLKSIIRVTKETQNPIAPALSLQNQAQILNTTQLMIEQAKWAALQADAKVYQGNLVQLASWIEQYYAPTPERSQLIKQIEALREIDVAPPALNINASLEALSQAMRKQPSDPAPKVKAASETSSESAKVKAVSDTTDQVKVKAIPDTSAEVTPAAPAGVVKP